jgi:hypothetical protein
MTYVRKTYGETKSYDPDTGEQIETPPELQAQIEAAMYYALEQVLEYVSTWPVDGNGSPV